MTLNPPNELFERELKQLMDKIENENEIAKIYCRVCDTKLKPKEYSSENLAYSKDKQRSYYICNKCRKKLLKLHDDVTVFIEHDVFFASVRE